MKNKKLFLGIALLISIIVTSMFLSHLSHISAMRKYKPLDGIRIVLDAGHGGKDEGARSNDVFEARINLSITKKLEKLLNEYGASVKLTRKDQADLASPSATNRKKEDMVNRVAIMNEEATDLYVSIHLNSYSNTNVKGAQAFYEKNNEVAKVFADIVQAKFKVLTNTKMTSKPGDYYILNNAHKIGVLVECGFLSNYEDRELLKTEDYQQEIAKALREAIIEYFNIIM